MTTQLQIRHVLVAATMAAGCSSAATDDGRLLGCFGHVGGPVLLEPDFAFAFLACVGWARQIHTQLV